MQEVNALSEAHWWVLPAIFFVGMAFQSLGVWTLSKIERRIRRAEPYLRMHMLLVEPDQVATIRAAQPEYMTADECRRAMLALNDNEWGWYLFTNKFTRAALETPGKTPLFKTWVQ